MFNKNKESNKVNTPAWTWKNTVYREARVCDWLRSFVPLVPAPIQKKKTNNTRRPALPFTGSRDRWPHLRPFISFPSGPSGMSYVLITGSSFLFPSILSFGWFTWSNCFPFLILPLVVCHPIHRPKGDCIHERTHTHTKQHPRSWSRGRHLQADSKESIKWILTIDMGIVKDRFPSATSGSTRCNVVLHLAYATFSNILDRKRIDVQTMPADKNRHVQMFYHWTILERHFC